MCTKNSDIRILTATDLIAVIRGSNAVRRIFYNIYLDLIMIIEDGPRQFDDKRSVKWAQERLQRDMNMLRLGDVPRDA